jgi:hypothetical protein
MIVNAPWNVPNTVIGRDLQIPTVQEEIHCYSSQYSARLSAHPNDLTSWSFQTTSDCEDTCQMICLLDEIPSAIVAFAVLVFKGQFVRLISNSHKKL